MELRRWLKLTEWIQLSWYGAMYSKQKQKQILTHLTSTVFVFKLYFTFKSSMFQMSFTMIRLFVVIISLFFAVMLTSSILQFFVDLVALGRLVSFSAAFSLYIIGCGLAVHFFSSTILKLAKLQRTSSRNLSESQNEVTLNQRQQKLADLATKSMMLFGIQIGSSIITGVLGWAFSFVLRGSLVSLDVTFNLFCAYCQFAFAEMHYRKCCGFCDDKFRDMMSNRIRRSVSVVSPSTGQSKTLERIS